MLTSIRGLYAATFSTGLLLSATPAFANETAIDDTSSEVAESTETTTVLDSQITRENEPVVDSQSSSLGEDSGISFSANVALATEYRFRGVGLSDGQLAIQGGFDLSHTSGLYAGTWASSLDEDTVGFGSTELDIYGGWSGDITDGITADVGVIGYLFPDAAAAAGPTDYVEFYGSLSGSLGPASVTGGVAYAPDQDSLGSTDNLYVYSDVSVGITGTALTLNGHIGYTDGFLTFTNDSQAIDWSLSADFAYGPATISAAYVGVEGDTLIDPAGTFTDDAFVVTVSASF
ncbi:MAG: TorF family putative porin [Erythrobacter sp.]